MSTVQEINEIIRAPRINPETEIKKNKHKIEIREKRGYQLLTADQYNRSFINYSKYMIKYNKKDH